jgi:hypothetical protein
MFLHEIVINMLVVLNYCRHVTKAKSLGKDQTKKRKTLLKKLKDGGMTGVVEMQRTPRMMFL